MASVPSFDPNTFIPSIKEKDWKALQKDPYEPTKFLAVDSNVAIDESAGQLFQEKALPIEVSP